jgi:hypothetical protein
MVSSRQPMAVVQQDPVLQEPDSEQYKKAGICRLFYFSDLLINLPRQADECQIRW